MPTARRDFYGYEYRPPAEDVDAEYPLFFTTGRVVSQYLSGNQTRRIGPLVDQYPEPLCEMHPVAGAQSWESPTETWSAFEHAAARSQCRRRS